MERINEETHHVVFMVKRPSYEFVFAVPKAPATFCPEERAVCQVYFKDSRPTGSFALNLEELEDFYTGLSGLMEYLWTERERRRPSLGPHEMG